MCDAKQVVEKVGTWNVVLAKVELFTRFLDRRC